MQQLKYMVKLALNINLRIEIWSFFCIDIRSKTHMRIVWGEKASVASLVHISSEHFQREKLRIGLII